VLRNIAGGTTGVRRKVHNKELHDFYSLSNSIITYQGKWGVGVCCDMGGKRNTYRVLVQRSN